MAKVLSVVPQHFLEGVLVAVALVLESGNLSVEHIENVLNRPRPTPQTTPVFTHLTVGEAPLADMVRYYGLRMEVDHA